MTRTIDDAPSCGQENDYRRAHSSAGIDSAPKTIEQILFDHFYTGEPGQHEAIKTAAAALRTFNAAQSAWQPIKTAPKDGTAVMLGFWYQGRFAQYQAFYGEHGWMENSRSYHSKQFQKWFELWHLLPASPSLPSTNQWPQDAIDQEMIERTDDGWSLPSPERQ